MCPGGGCDYEEWGQVPVRNVREGGERSGDRVEGGGGERIRRRDRDTWGVRERRGRVGMW